MYSYETIQGANLIFGFRRMSLLPSGTYASPLNPYYGAGGGPAPPGSLDSPVVVVANAGDGSARLVLPADVAASASITMGSGDPWEISTNALAPTNLTISYENGTTNPVYVSLDDSIDAVALGSGVAGGVVKSQNKLEVSDLSIPSTNSVRIAATSATAGQITNTVAASGTLSLGSSTANSGTLVVSDVARPGIATYLQVNGTTGSVPLFVAGAQGPAGGCSIFPDATPPTAAELLLGSDSVNSNAIQITNTATNIKQLGGAPQVLSGAPQTIAPAGSALVSLPAGEGLYAIVACGVGGTSTGQTRQAQLSCFCYINSGGLCQMGGSATTDVGALASTDNVTLQVNPGGTAMNVYNNSLQSLVAYQVQAFKISGPIPGAV